ncbi:hypothetical protein EA848_21495, partial [Vibrio anguillarum]|uniref:rolling circle replication-associated protein n=1 Tax=Vibrio anguillarum TaxID=55601 RepID=UPI001E00F8BC|nr:hypothetical protein [Vibrio anguillarum]
MQLVYRPAPQDAPPTNNGDRYTEKLSARAVRKIFESGAYVAATKGGFTTFLTLTFDDIQRSKLFATNSNIHLPSQGCEFTPITEDLRPYSPLQMTLGNEVSRFLDSAKRVYQRGFSYKLSELKGQGNLTLGGDDISVDGHYKPAPLKSKDGLFELVGPARVAADFDYIWVAECPENEHGQPNPHVHVLLNWEVEENHFQAWADRLASIWGHGFANLKRIKTSMGAASYLVKALGYAAKGNNCEQGLIKGNRYNIARCSRAPNWDVLAAFDVDNMASIIRECGYKLEKWRKPLEKEINRKKFKKDELIKVFAIENKKGEKKKIFKLQSLIKRLETEITEHKEILKSRGAFARSDNIFSITFEGEQAAEKMDTFLNWAAGARRWSMKCDEINMDDIQQNALLQYSS